MKTADLRKRSRSKSATTAAARPTEEDASVLKQKIRRNRLNYQGS